jgi:hypothetical protein
VHKTKPVHSPTSKHYHHNNKELPAHAQIQRSPAITPTPIDAPTKHTKEATPHATPLDQQPKFATPATKQDGRMDMECAVGTANLSGTPSSFFFFYIIYKITLSV